MINENSPNPRLDDILVDDMDKNPEDYYIWRTKKDDKVRGKHAEREGEIFNWHVPPEGGHPGEDYNCRCWAEPYDPERYADKPMIVDVSGLDIFKNQKDFDLQSFSQYAQNDKAGVMSDAVNYNPNYISDEELYQRMWNNIKKYENIKYHPYLDSKGYITTGGGANINSLNDFMKVNFTVNGYPATDTQKLMGYNKLRDLSNQKDAYGNYINRDRTADSFLNDTNLQISEQDAYNMAQNHMKNDLAHVRNQFTEFDYFPNQLKEVLLDIQYNTGGLNKQNWPNLFKAINNRDVNGIANNVHRKDVGWERNDWAERMSRSIRF